MNETATVEAFRVSEAGARRQWRWAAVSVLLATLAIASLAWAMLRENSFRQKEAAQNALLAKALEDKQKALDQVRDLTVQMQSLIATSPTGSTTLIREVQQQTERIADKVEAAEAEQAPLKLPARGRTAGVQLLTLGWAAGWDVDVFWCAGPGEERNYSAAWSISTLLGRNAAVKRPLAPGVSLGRVRLRPVREQDRRAWSDGAYAVYDSGPGEREAAQALSSFVAGKIDLPLGARAAPGDQRPSRWYLSVMTCFNS